MTEWVQELSAEERAYWESKPASDKAWWDANTRPEDRAELLRSEMDAKRLYEELQALPASTRKAIVDRLEKEAEEALARIRDRLPIPQQLEFPRRHEEE